MANIFDAADETAALRWRDPAGRVHALSTALRYCPARPFGGPDAGSTTFPQAKAGPATSNRLAPPAAFGLTWTLARGLWRLSVSCAAPGERIFTVKVSRGENHADHSSCNRQAGQRNGNSKPDPVSPTTASQGGPWHHREHWSEQ